MSNRLTFSLASLVLIFAMVFSAMPVLAADGGPTVTIGTISGNRAGDSGATPPTTGITVEVTFSVPVTVTEVAEGDLLHTVKDVDGGAIGTVGAAADSVATVPAGETGTHNKFKFTLPNITDNTAHEVVVWVPADIAMGLTPGGTAGPGNQVSAFKTHTLPPLHTGKVEIIAAEDETDTDTSDGQTYTLQFVFKAQTGAPAVALDDSRITVTPTHIRAPITLGAAAQGTGDDSADYIYNATIIYFGGGTITVGLESSYVAAANVTPAVIPLPKTPDPVPPMATITIEDFMLGDNGEGSFFIDVMFSNGDDVKPAKLGLSMLDVKDSSDPVQEVTLTEGLNQKKDNSYKARMTFDYDPRFITLPLNIKVKQTVVKTSNPDYSVPVEGPMKPAAPANVAAMADQATDMVRLTWDASEGATSYKIAQTGAAAMNYTATASPFMTPELAAGTYMFTVTASNAVGDSDPSASVSATIDAPLVTSNPPAAAIAVSELNQAARTFKVSVTLTPAAKSDGSAGDDITGFDSTYLDIMDASGDVGITASAERNPANSYVAILKYDELAVLPLTVKVDQAMLVTSNPDHSATVDSPPAPATPANVAASADQATNMVTLTWTASAGATSYKIAQTMGTDTVNYTAMESPFTTPELGAGTYMFTVMASNAAGDSAPSASVSATINAPVVMVPGPPTGVGAKADQGANTIAITWTAPASDGGSAITGYMVTKHYMKDGAAATKGFSATASPLIIPPAGSTDMLPQDVSYTFTVKAMNSAGYGPDSAPSAAVMIDMDPTAPGMPTNLVAIPNQATDTITLTWDAPEDNGGAAIMSYAVTMNGRAQRAATTTSFTTSRLLAGTYTFTVAATNSAGTGSPTGSVAAVIDPAPAAGAPAAPTGLSAMVNANDSVTLTWTEPAGAVTYQVDVINQATNRRNSYQIPKTPAYTTPVLSAGSYLIAVAAHNAVGRGDSAAVQVTIAAAPPVTPTRPATIEIPTSRSSSPLIALPSVTIPAHGYLVLVRDETESGTYTPTNWMRQVAMSGLPDLELFFRNGGTIALMGTGAQNQRDVVISEIMWGSDSSLAAPEYSQWIEFYNTTPNAISLAGFGIQFHRSDVAAAAWAGYHDLVANSGFHVGYWNVPGQSGRTNPVDTSGRFAGTVPLHSMYRNINYTRVENPAYVANRDERLKGCPGGTGSGSWKKSESPNANIGPQWIATPGAPHQLRVSPANTTFARRVIITEIGNSNNDAYDWIELYNKTDGTINLKKWAITRVENEGGVGKEHRLFFFPDNDNIQLPAKSHLVIAASNPTDDGNDLAAGIRINTSDANQLNTGLGSKVGIGHHANNTTAYYYVNSGFKLPNDNNRRLIVLRTANDKQGQPTHVEDFIGTLSIALRGELSSGWTWYDANARRFFNTATWPFQGAGGRHSNVIDGTGDEDFRAGRVIQRNDFGNGFGQKVLSVRGYTGIGYDRHAPVNAENGGTPGYSKDAIKSKAGEVAGTVTISEIMLATDEESEAGRLPRATRLPQWFELYNGSLTQAVNVNNWYLEIQNADSDDLETRNLSGTLRLPNVIIQPNQTILIVSDSGLNSGNFPAQRTINLYTNGTYRNILNLRARGDSVLSQVGFYIELRDHENRHVDEIGNLGYSRRAGTNRADNFDNEWEMPSLHSEEGYRTSLLRVYDEGVARDGLMAESWRRASDTNFRYVTRSLTYFGNQNDFGTPGYRGGGPLPVSLSKFRPQRLDTGEVVIHWTTESELNNAGFNILRTEKRDGVFQQVNTELIKGHGTTSERNTYTWTDTSAKPNVVYYYQIQDVSLDGQVQTLRISRLKGNVSAAGKVTTTWGELKSLQ